MDVGNRGIGERRKRARRRDTQRLDSLTAGTQSFANAMQDVAAASEEQSASTEQIAAAAAHLTLAAERVAKASRSFTV